MVHPGKCKLFYISYFCLALFEAYVIEGWFNPLKASLNSHSSPHGFLPINVKYLYPSHSIKNISEVAKTPDPENNVEPLSYI